MARFSIWKGSISFGLLNIPVSLQSAKEGKELHFQMLDSKDFSPIRYKKINAQSGKEVPYERIVKGYEYEPDQFVVMSKQDFAAANPKATQTLDIEDFVPLDEIDLMMFDRPYFLVPRKSGEKGYFLLRDALERSKRVAIGKIVIRTKQHLCAVMVRSQYLICELLRFPHEMLDVDEAEYLDHASRRKPYSPKELKMAEELIERGAAGALVSVGGDLAVRGRPPVGDRWSIALEDPAQPGRALCDLFVDAGGVATSSTLSRRWRAEHADHHHLIDPATGRSADTEVASITVVADAGWRAEVLATGAAIGGVDGAIGYLEGQGVYGVVVDRFGAVRAAMALPEAAAAR